MRFIVAVLAGAVAVSAASIPENLRSALTFHASFDHGATADFAKGDKQIYVASDYKVQNTATPGLKDGDPGPENGALRFRKKNTRAVFFRGEKHIAPTGGTFSYWLRLDPQKDLEPGFSDPLQLTDKDYNNSAIWTDFSKDDVPRNFRMGVFGALKVWNPKDLPPDTNPAFNNRLIIVKRPPFAGDKWTHIVVTWSGLSAGNGHASLFLDGKRIAPARTVPEKFENDMSRLAIRLGVNYIGLMDELAAFDRELTDAEVAALHRAGR